MHSAPSPIDPAVSELLQLFEGPLKEVEFPGAIGASQLSELATGLERAADEVTRLEALLEAARSTVLEQRQALVARSHRALAYARVYAEDVPTLREQLDHIQLPKVSKARNAADLPDGPVKPIRRRRNPVTSAQLPIESDVAAAE
ncbi:MAG: hypothetical protein HOW73_21770 [Polyangiaceae bacterium]|nr:hypothetical protein [Polyangiaceae bacterium]